MQIHVHEQGLSDSWNYAELGIVKYSNGFLLDSRRGNEGQYT